MSGDGIAILLMAGALSAGLMVNSYQSWKDGKLFADAWPLFKGVAAFLLIPAAIVIAIGILQSVVSAPVQAMIRDGFIWLLIICLIVLGWRMIKARRGALSDDSLM